MMTFSHPTLVKKQNKVSMINVMIHAHPINVMCTTYLFRSCTGSDYDNGNLEDPNHGLCIRSFKLVCIHCISTNTIT